MAPERAPEEKPTHVSEPFLPGSVLSNRYRIDRPIGKGGFGLVYLAHDQQLHQKPVVVKVLEESGGQDEWLQTKFRKECEALARIDHPGVVGVLDQGTAEGRLFLVMQFVDGVTLRSALEKGPLELSRAASLLSQTAEALTAAHDQGVYHRDLKPENIMVRKLPTGREQAVIIDFGIAGVTDSVVASATQTKVAGSLQYMAPEQMAGKPETASDIYSLGVIAYEMVTGRPPFQCNSPVELYFQQQKGVQQKPSQLRPEIPAGADEAILKALAFDPKSRYASAMQFGEDFSKGLAEPTRTEETQRTPEPVTYASGQRAEPEMAFVLFMDVVGYSQLATDRQITIIEELQEVVRSTAEYRKAQARRDLISLPTGDGMALVFFKDPTSPVACAIEVWRALRERPEIRLRMGVNQGPVYRVADINQNRNVAGGGINMAQRVMDCADAGHILVSRSVADNLSQLSEWSPWLRDLGECEVKHGVRIYIYNICKDDVGNPARPKKLGPEKRTPWRMYAGIAALVVALAAAAVFGLRSRPTGKPRQAPLPAVQRTLTYYFSVQKPHSPNWVRYSQEMVVPAGYMLRFYFNSPEAGHLYLLNEGPVPRHDMASFNTLFPSYLMNHGSSALNANQGLQYPAGRPLVLDPEQGTEKVYMIWSSRELPELEALKKWADPSLHRLGDIESPADVAAIQGFLRSHPTATARVDQENNRTVLIQASDPLVYMVRLAHQ